MVKGNSGGLSRPRRAHARPARDLRWQAHVQSHLNYLKTALNVGRKLQELQSARSENAVFSDQQMIYFVQTIKLFNVQRFTQLMIAV